MWEKDLFLGNESSNCLGRKIQIHEVMRRNIGISNSAGREIIENDQSTSKVRKSILELQRLSNFLAKPRRGAPVH